MFTVKFTYFSVCAFELFINTTNKIFLAFFCWLFAWHLIHFYLKTNLHIWIWSQWKYSISFTHPLTQYYLFGCFFYPIVVSYLQAWHIQQMNLHRKQTSSKLIRWVCISWKLWINANWICKSNAMTKCGGKVQLNGSINSRHFTPDLQRNGKYLVKCKNGKRPSCYLGFQQFIEAKQKFLNRTTH